MSETSRRNVLAGAAGVGAAAVLAACGGNSSDTGSTAGSNTNTGGQAATNTGAPAAPSTGQQQGGQQAGGTAIKKADIPVGGGKVFTEQGFVVTQPTAGEFKAFSAKCTHAGCMVNRVSGGTINCPCHGSKFSAADGSVKSGPAPAPLAARTLTANGDSLTVA